MMICGLCGRTGESLDVAVCASASVARDGWVAIRCHECGGFRAAQRAGQARDRRELRDERCARRVVREVSS